MKSIICGGCNGTREITAPLSFVRVPCPDCFGWDIEQAQQALTAGITAMEDELAANGEVL